VISFLRVSGVPQKGESPTPLTRKKEITMTKSRPKDTDTAAGTDAGTAAGTDADTDVDACTGPGPERWRWSRPCSSLRRRAKSR